jgi:hypothetical protein
MGLQSSFLHKIWLPRNKGGMSSVKDKIVPLFPYLPGSNDEDFHEESAQELLFSLGYHLKEICTKILMYAKLLPTALTEWATEEEMKGCFTTVAFRCLLLLDRRYMKTASLNDSF